LSDFVNRLASQLGLPSGEYALMFEGQKKFVTEKNKASIQQGFLLTLSFSPVNINILKFDLNMELNLIGVHNIFLRILVI